jgi:hypothetical protein
MMMGAGRAADLHIVAALAHVHAMVERNSSAIQSDGVCISDGAEGQLTGQSSRDTLIRNLPEQRSSAHLRV